MGYFRSLLIIFLVVACHSMQPTPNCSREFFYQTLPVTPYQLIRYDLDDLFTGYNVEFSLQDASDFDFVNVTQKLTINGQQTLVDEIKGLKSIHLDQVGNEWGEGFIALSQVGNATIVQYGLLANNKSAPVINYRVIVQNQSNIKCFDAVQFAAKDIVMLDCMLIRPKVGEDGKLFQNRFIYVSLSKGTILPVHVDNQLYVNFTKIEHRRLMMYTDHETGHSFMLRAYYADGVDIKNRHNTYIDVFVITQPTQPWTLKVIDRSVIHKTEFAITDIKVYLGDIYVLDYWQGLYRVDLTNHMQIILLGHYPAQGFTRFSVYSGDLDNQFLVALANTHYVVEVDWSSASKPILQSKYTILPNSTVEQVAVNEEYLIVQSFTMVNTSKGEVSYNYTWIFNRGDRSYNKVFKVINHNTYRTAIFLNKAKSYLMVIDEDKLVNYALNRPMLNIHPKNNETLMDQPLNFTVVARSSDPMSTQRVSCKLTVNFTIVSQNNKTLWPTGKTPPSTFSVNAPGELYVPISQYVLGPNITYEFTAFGPNPPNSYVLQQDLMGLHWDKSPGLIASRFLHADLWKENDGNDTVIIYLQDFANKLYVSVCETKPLDLQVYCNNSRTYDASGAITNWGSTTFLSRNTLNIHHVIAFTLDNQNSTIYINDLTEDAGVTHLHFPEGYQGYVTSMQITNHYLVVVFQYIKTIKIFDLNMCNADHCRQVYEINSTTMRKLGVNYFAPINVETSIFHPQVIFIQTLHSVIILDIDREHHPVLLATLESEATNSTNSQFKMTMNKDFLILSNIPSNIEEYDITRLYQFEVVKTKNYPLYGYTLPEDYDLDISDQGDSIFISTLSPEGLRDVFVYRGGYPCVATLYDTVLMEAGRQILIDVTGFGVDYLVTVVGSIVRIHKQLDFPLAIATNVNNDTEFALEYYNDASKDSNLSIITVKVQNWPMIIKVKDYFKDIMNTKDLLQSGTNYTCQFDDEQWHTGHVVNITAVCKDCGDKVIVKGHIHMERQILAVPGMHDYQWGFDGGSVQQESHLIHLMHNGSIDQFVNLPQAVFSEKCTRVAVPIIGSYHVSACESNAGVQLYITSFISKKGFSWGPWSSGASKVNRIQVVRQLVMIVDTDVEWSLKPREGGIFIYAINVDPDKEEILQEIDIINSDDFGGVAGWDSSQKAYLNNAELTWTYQTDTYRLFITEMNKGMFVVDFTWANGKPELTVKNVDFIDLHKLLEDAGYQMPYDARFQAVTVLTSEYDSVQGLQNQTILVTTGRFHTFQIRMITDNAGKVVSLLLERVYLRYGSYHVQNYIRHHNDYFLISHIVPSSNTNKSMSQQILSIYHTKGEFNGTVENRSMRSGHVMDSRNFHLYDFNWTYMDKESQRVGVVLVDRQAKAIKELSVYKNITVTTKSSLPTQIIRLNFSNDYSYDTVRIYLKGTSSYPRWKVVLIVIFGLIGLVMVAGVGLVAFKKIKAKRDNYNQGRESLISDTT